MQLRPYQEKAIQAIHNEWNEGHKNTLLVLPTGTGKTIVFSKVVEDRVKDGKRALILAHRGELLEQASSKLKTASGLDSALEKATSTSIGTNSLSFSQVFFWVSENSNNCLFTSNWAMKRLSTNLVLATHCA